MRRRELMLLLGGVTALLPLTARGQQKAVPVVGWLYINSPPANLGDLLRGPIHQGLSEAGFVEGQNMAAENRWAEGHYDRLPALIADLVSRKVDLIVAVGGPCALAAKGATTTIPIVFFVGVDPVEFGLIASLARPGGNLTGVTVVALELTPKRFELLCELVPQAKVIALLVNQSNANAERTIRDMREAAHAKGMQLDILKASAGSEVDAAFATIAQRHVGALVVSDDPFFNGNLGRDQLVALATRYRVPAIYAFREAVAAGGLISYGANATALFRQVGIYAGKILNGEKPADLPVQQPTTFELVINLKTATALGLTVPQSLLQRANEVIE
jgi:putative ABC transport system substrate-binding protein